MESQPQNPEFRINPAQKNRFIQMVLLNTHNICFCSDIRKLIFNYTFLTKYRPGHVIPDLVH